MSGSDLSRPTTSNSQYIIQLQQYLRALSYEYREIPAVAVNGIFDVQTEAALKMFQTLSGLEATGTADPFTWELLRKQYLLVQDTDLMPYLFDAFPSSDSVFSAGDFHPSIYSVQHAFQTLSKNYDNFSELEFTGILDPATEANIRELRTVSLLPEGTHIDRDLWNILILIHNSVR